MAQRTTPTARPLSQLANGPKLRLLNERATSRHPAVSPQVRSGVPMRPQRPGARRTAIISGSHTSSVAGSANVVVDVRARSASKHSNSYLPVATVIVDYAPIGAVAA